MPCWVPPIATSAVSYTAAANARARGLQTLVAEHEGVQGHASTEDDAGGLGGGVADAVHPSSRACEDRTILEQLQAIL